MLLLFFGVFHKEWIFPSFFLVKVFIKIRNIITNLNHSFSQHHAYARCQLQCTSKLRDRLNFQRRQPSQGLRGKKFHINVRMIVVDDNVDLWLIGGVDDDHDVVIVADVVIDVYRSRCLGTD